MRALSLFGVLILAKLLVLAGTGQPLSPWAPVAYFWQDAAVALAAAGIDSVFKRPRVAWLLYAALVFYIAWGVPVAIVLGTPLTWSLLEAARGPLADSITYYVTIANILRIVAVLAAGVALPMVLPRLTPARFRAGSLNWKWVSVAVALVFVAVGPVAAAHVDTMGLDRNAVTALLPVRLPSAPASTSTTDWRTSPLPLRRGAGGTTTSSPAALETMSRLRGSAKGMNLLVVFLESTAAQYLRPYGAAEDPMPRLTELAEHALLFENAYATYPESIKGLFSILCSQYPAFGESAEAHSRRPCAPVASELSAAGYQTALFHSGRFGYLGMDAILEHKGFGVLEDAGAIGGNVESSFGVDEPSTVNRILSWIDQRPAQTPFVATYLPVAGHHPYATPSPGPFPSDTDLNRYRNALHYGDEALGALLDGLHARGLEDRTAVIVFGDHGEAFGQHRGNMGHTLFINEENVRIPLLIAVPGVTSRGARSSEVVSLIDVAPTVLDLVGLPAPAGYQGTTALRPGSRMALFLTDYSLGLLGLRDSCWKYIFEVDAGRSKLFDVCRDAAETRDRAVDEPDRVGAYRDRVLSWSASQRLK